jgi:hypothetical protein
MPWSYAVLIPLSGSYPPVTGRLHTRYSPVRRSPPSEDVLPLDLHVLGLSLAFILSQDQTLRCRKDCWTYANMPGLY